MQNINDTFFEGIYKDIWKKMIPAGLSEAEGDFLMEVCGLQNNSKLLDLMCGYGRHALDLARRGVMVTAVDNSQDYIEQLNKVAGEEGLKVQAICQDVNSLQIQGQYDSVICMGNSFAFFDKAEAMKLLKKISEHLKPGGFFILNSWMIAEIAIRHFKEKEWYRIGDYKYLLDYKFQFYPSRIESEHTIVDENGVVEVIRGVDYIFTLGELDEMFRNCGLTVKELYSTPRKKKFAMGDSRIYIVAEKLIQ